MMGNIATITMQKLSNMMVNVDNLLAKIGETPYGVREATRKEQLAAASKLSADDIVALMDAHGVQEVNQWLSKFEPEEQQNGGQMV